MRGSAALRGLYQGSTSIQEELKTVLEFNVNGSFAPNVMGYYENQFTPVTTFTLNAGPAVTGASFVTKTVTVTKAIVEGTEDSPIASLRYVDEEDTRYTELFPIESIFQPYRPSPGIAKAVYTDMGRFQVPGPHVRFYPPSRDDNIKFWRSWSDVSGVRAGDPNALSGSGKNRIGYNMGPFAVWMPGSTDRGIWVNKIKISLQNYYALPTSYSIEVLTEGSQNWTSIWSNTDSGSAGSNPWALDGVLRIYYSGGVWSATPDLESLRSLRDQGPVTGAMKIRGIRLMVKKMRQFLPTRSSGLDYGTTIYSAPLEVIEMSPRLAIDVSDSVMSFSTVSNLSESDSPLMVGSISANDCNIKMENYGDLFDTSNINSLLYGYQLKSGALSGYIQSTFSSGQTEVNRIFYGNIETPEESGESEISISGMDDMSRLQQLKLKDFVCVNQRLSTIIRKIIDVTTGSDIDIVYDSISNRNEEDPIVDFFYANDKTAYDSLADLAETFQCSMAFDSDGVFKVFTKEYIVGTKSYQMLLVDSPTAQSNVLPNVKTIERSIGKPINDIKINWSPHSISSSVVSSDIGKPLWDAQRREAIEPAWEAEDMVLGAAPLVKTLLSTDTDFIYIDQEGGEYYDWDGYLSVNGEVIAYSGKEYISRQAGELIYKSYVIKSQQEYDSLISNMISGTRVYFSGRLAIAYRGAFGTTVAQHSVDMSATYPYANNTFGNFQSWKTSAYLSTSIANPRGATLWKYDGGSVHALRGSVVTSGAPTRNGSESAIRMVGPSYSVFSKYAATKNITGSACVNALNAYVGWTPIEGTGRIQPRRVSAGIRLLGRAGADGKTLAPVGQHCLAGVMMAVSGSNGVLNGWMAEISLSSVYPENNVRLMKMTDSGQVVRASGTHFIAPHMSSFNGYSSSSNTFYDVDISYWPLLDNGQDGIQVTVNGRLVISYTLPPGEAFGNTYAYGSYVRGNTYADFDYLYWGRYNDERTSAGWSDSSVTNTDEINIRDAIQGGVTGPVAWWGTNTEIMLNPYKSASGMFGLAEFGPITHEVRVLRPTWDKPYLNAELVRPTVSAGAYKVPLHSENRFGAELVVMNSRRHAVQIGSNGTRMAVVGIPVLSSDEELTLDEMTRTTKAGLSTELTLIRSKMQASRKVHGNIPAIIAASWIQKKSTAENMIRFIANHCTIDCDTVELTIFGNPILEPGDHVKIVSQSAGYNGTVETFVVLEVKNDWNQGLETGLTVRRVV